jgi:outer membrane protein
MKKLFLILALALPMFAFAQKAATPSVVAHVNTQEIMAVMPELKTVSARFDSLQTAYENQLANMQEEFNKKVAEFQQQQATMSTTVKEFRQQELAEMQQRIEMFYQTVQKDLQTKQAEYMKPLQDKLLAAINKVAAAKGCTYVLESAAMLYAAPDALNITADVKASLGIK